MNVFSGHPQNLKLQVGDVSSLTARGRRRSFSSPCRVQCPVVDPRRQHGVAVVRRAVSGESSSSGGDEDEDDDQADKKQEQGSLSREDLERLVGPDDAQFNGLELANLIRKKYGRSYDVTLIKKEFMGRNLLAMNVMWKYREQRSFPLSEEEYLLRLDDVANTLKCWGAVSHVRNTLEKLKERPRIGKVSYSLFFNI